MKEALLHGRKKGNNVMIGPSNCGKTFLLKPLTEIFHCFPSPASGTFAWVGVEKAEVVLLNDLRWNDNLIAWSVKPFFAEDVLWSQKTPIFATSSSKVRKYDDGVMNDIETGMMEVRWKYFHFNKQIENPKQIQACRKCFATFILY